jgi:tellurite resistance protein
MSDGGDADRETSPDSDTEFDADAERRALLREIAEDVRGDTSESEQVSAILYRVSDLYDPDEDTSPEEIYRNVRHIVDIKERGGLRTE